MSCISPTEMKIDTHYKGKQTIKIDCRHCMNCMIKRQQNIEFLAKKELLYNYKRGQSASFVTFLRFFVFEWQIVTVPLS